MDNSSASGGRQPARQRELHGPRPAPLTVRKESRKIKKLPAAPPPQPQQQQYRPPVIIYTASPKVIHTTSADFMSVVQSLTGVRKPAASNPEGDRGQAPFSPAARLAAFEKIATSPSASGRTLKRKEVDDVAVEVISSPGRQRREGGGGILSPGPSSLPWISPAVFTPSAIVTPPVIQFVASPNSNLFFSGMVPSPVAYWDLFNHYHH
ncbi:protein MKS1-like [Zingiber officinale]|uniref:VQ domain-containing protein n=1 Tax=Zingiber officinale TaxID=94328 RepID=A0A8J5GZ90_ZINOF|nr:protein MKS1-like [Zingiber officinale]KAG6511854.1 hypothetical protein ZIOFF_029932 [Zingiber officinale]